MYRNLQKLKVCSNTGSKSIDSKIEQNIKEQQALYDSIDRLDNKLARTQKEKSIKRATQLAAELDYVDSAIKSRQAQVAHLKLQTLCLDNEIAKFSTVPEKSDAEKRLREIEVRLLNNNGKKNLLKMRASQLETVVTDMLLKRQKFLKMQNTLISDLMNKKQELDELINSHTNITSNDAKKCHIEPVQPSTNHLQDMQPFPDATKLNRMFQKVTQKHNANAR